MLMRELKPYLQQQIKARENTLEVYITNFLLSNSRRDRDNVLKKRTEIQTLNKLFNELF